MGVVMDRFWDKTTICVAGIGAAALAALGGLTFYANSQDNDVKPVVVTTEDNKIVDMPAGVRWDVKMESGVVTVAMVERCDQTGGELISYASGMNVCEEVDF